MGRSRHYRVQKKSFGSKSTSNPTVTFKGVVKEVITDNEHP